MNKTCKRLISLLICLAMVLAVLPMAVFAANATTIYMQPNSNWLIDGARFAAYFFGDGEAWVDMTDPDGDGIYEVAVPEGGYTSVIFCRMNPNTTANNWTNKWNQTADLTIPTADDTKVIYVVQDGSWDKGLGQWIEPDGELEEVEVVYYLRGTMNEWAADESNAMTDNGDGTWTITMALEAGTYEYKAADAGWGNAWPYGTANATVTVETACDVTFTLNTNDNTLTATGDGVAAEEETEIVYYLRGDMNSWGTDNAMSDEDGDGIWTVTITLEAGTYEYKAADADWTANWPISGNQTLVVATACDVTFTLNTIDNTLTATGEGVTEAVQEYCLVGWINGANYGCEEDYENVGEYVFVDGTLTTIFESDSYIFVKTTDNNMWFMAEVYDDDNLVVLYSGMGYAEKMYAPAGVELTYTLVENEDGSLTLSYVAGTCYHYNTTIVSDATCTTAGTQTETCNYCGEVLSTTEVDALGHTETTTIVDATCTTAGSETISCSVCGEILSVTEIAALDHTWTDATCTTPKTCSVCGEIEGEALGHSEITTNVEATCTTAGSETVSCSVCGEVISTTEIAALGHTYVDGTCSVCGEADPDYVEPITKFDLAGMTMSLGNSLAANFVVMKSNLDGDGYYAVITKAYANSDPVTVTIPMDQWSAYGSVGYYFTYAGVTAKEMTDVITVDVYNADNVQVMNTYTRTIEDYCYQQLVKEEALASPNAENLALYTDILKYGAAAQNYFDGYNADNLATARLTEAQLAYGTQEVTMTDIRQKGDGYLGSTLSLKSEISMNFVFANATIGNAAYATVSFTDHYGNLKETTVQAADFQAYSTVGKYIVVDGMGVADCFAQITVILYAEDGTVLSTNVDSVEAYIARMSGADEVYPAILKLATSAYNYFH